MGGELREFAEERDGVEDWERDNGPASVVARRETGLKPWGKKGPTGEQLAGYAMVSRIRMRNRQRQAPLAHMT